ncbi:MAG: peptide chain release factor N(5)-glutamine methyltransferase [Limnochordia bacterium]
MRGIRHTVLDLVRLSTSYLAERGVETPRLDAEVLLAHVLGLDRLSLYVNFDRPLEPHEVDLYREAIRRRGRREPVAYILGEKEFMKKTFTVSPAVLIPRPETELLVETAITRIEEAGAAPVSLLDVGTGSGVIAIMLALAFPLAEITASDASSQALAVARQNAVRHNVASQIKFVQSDMLDDLPSGARYHAIVSNPPYVSETELAGLAPDIRYEPRMALDGGADGLVLVRRLLSEARERLIPGGFLAMEIGANQGEAVRLMAEERFQGCAEILRDYAGRERFAFIRKVES